MSERARARARPRMRMRMRETEEGNNASIFHILLAVANGEKNATNLNEYIGSVCNSKCTQYRALTLTNSNNVLA